MKKTILIIEDTSRKRVNISDWLELKDFNLICAKDGISGILLAKMFPVDLIISEINLSKLNGFEVLKELRKNFSTAKTPFIFLTAKTDPETRNLAQQLGANDYLTQPLRFSDFLQIIKNQLDSPSEINQNQQALHKAEKSLVNLC
ncbi:MAG: response regulator [Coleofasciculaceae cyanobacterium]